MKMTPCNDYFFVLDRVKPITEGAIESWLVGAEPKFRDIIDGKVRQHRFVCKSNIINHVRFTLKGMILYWKGGNKGMYNTNTRASQQLVMHMSRGSARCSVESRRRGATGLPSRCGEVKKAGGESEKKLGEKVKKAGGESEKS